MVRISPLLVRQIVNNGASPSLSVDNLLEATVGADVGDSTPSGTLVTAAAAASGIPSLVHDHSADTARGRPAVDPRRSAADAAARARSLSLKRASDGEERTRSESLKRAKVTASTTEEAERNTQILIDMGVSLEKQKKRFKNLTGSALIVQQKAVMEWAHNSHSGKRGGSK